MTRRRSAAALAALCLGAGALAAGCGGESVSEATTTGPAATTAPATTAATTAPSVTTAPSGPTTGATAPAVLGAESLPPEDAVPGTRAATPRSITSATEFVDVLYQAGDPAKAAAVRRLEAGGYEQGVLRDQVGADPSSGVALLRTYALRLRDADAARQEVDDAVDEVARTPAFDSTEVDPGIPDGRALRVAVEQGGVKGAVLFVTFPGDDVVYGLQAVAANGGTVPEEAVLAAARDLASSVGAAP